MTTTKSWRAKLATLMLALCAASVAPPVAAGEGERASDRAEKAPYVRPDVAAFLKGFYANPVPPPTREVIAQIRKVPPDALIMTKLDLPVGEIAVQQDLTMPGPAGPMRLRLYDVRAERRPGPVVVFYHGGGYVTGAIETHAGLAADISRVLDLPVVSVDYRLAPESPFPAAVDDGEAAARWVAANGKALGREVTGLVLAGDSAGGNLTVVTSAALRDRPAGVPVLLQIPIYPATDFAKAYPSQSQLANGYTLDAASLALMVQHYAADPASSRASAIADDLAGLPPTVLVTASLDPLRDQGRAYAAKLIEAGVPTVFYEAQGMIHGFATYRRAIPSAQTDTKAIFALARTMLEAGPQANQEFDMIVSK